jgi:hypothetical protein
MRRPIGAGRAASALEEEAADEEHDQDRGEQEHGDGPSATGRRRGALPWWAGAGAVLMAPLDHRIGDTERSASRRPCHGEAARTSAATTIGASQNY